MRWSVAPVALRRSQQFIFVVDLKPVPVPVLVVVGTAWLRTFLLETNLLFIIRVDTWSLWKDQSKSRETNLNQLRKVVRSPFRRGRWVARVRL